MDEPALIREASRGDLDSFNRLVLEYQEMVYNQAYRLLGDPDGAADAAQETFISAYHHLRSFRGGSFKAWLLRIAANTCYDELRRQKRRPTQPLEPVDEDEEEIESPSWLADPAASPEAQVEQQEVSQAIQDCLEGLPPEFRLAVVLVDLQGLDYAEASQAMGKPLGTVKSRLARARLRLQDCLHGFWELLPSIFRPLGES